MQEAKNLGGRPLELTEDKIEHILSFVEDGVIVHQVARLSCTPHTNLHRWLGRGKEDAMQGIDNLYSRLWTKFEEKRAAVIKKWMGNIGDRLTNWQANAWLLERCFREDFGLDAGSIQELFNNYLKLKQDYDKLASQSIKGSIDHG